ncbi:MAG: ankyrin repeat domain-containing protein [Planctomycetota bacterium]
MRERFLSALAGDKPDRTPVAHVAALTTVQLRQATGCWMPQVHHDAEQQARLLAANHEALGFDAVSFIINYFGEPAALGIDMDWGGPERVPAFRSAPWQHAEDAVAPDGGTMLGSSYRAAGPPTTASYRLPGVGLLPLVAMLPKALNISEMVEGVWHADIDAKGYRRRGTPLHCAAARGHETAIEVLVEHGADVMAPDSQWRTPLHDAASADRVDAITTLLRLGANINAVGKNDMSTPLEEAVNLEQINATRVLLEHGALADLDALIDQKEQDLAHIPLAPRETKDKYRDLIALLKEYKRKRTAERPATYLQSESIIDVHSRRIDGWILGEYRCDELGKLLENLQRDNCSRTV